MNTTKWPVLKKDPMTRPLLRSRRTEVAQKEDTPWWHNKYVVGVAVVIGASGLAVVFLILTKTI